MDGKYYHYIEIDADGYVVHAFSDAFEDPGPDSILVNDNGLRQFNLQTIGADMDRRRWDAKAKKIVDGGGEAVYP